MALFPTDGQFGGIGGNQPNAFGGGFKMRDPMRGDNWWTGNRGSRSVSGTPGWQPWSYLKNATNTAGGGNTSAGFNVASANQNSANMPSYPGGTGLGRAPGEIPGGWGNFGVRRQNLGNTGGGGGNTGYRSPWDITGFIDMLGGTDLPDPYDPYGYTVPGEWNPENYDIPELRTSPWDVINSSLPFLDEQRQRGFSEAAKRMGSTGMLVSTPYANALGDVERRTQEDLTRLTQGQLYDAAKLEAQMEQARRESALDRALSGWQTHGGWDVGLQQLAGQQDFGGWQQFGDWQMQGQMNDQSNLMNLLSMFLPYIMRGR